MCFPSIYSIVFLIKTGKKEFSDVFFLFICYSWRLGLFFFATSFTFCYLQLKRFKEIDFVFFFSKDFAYWKKLFVDVLEFIIYSYKNWKEGITKGILSLKKWDYSLICFHDATQNLCLLKFTFLQGDKFIFIKCIFWECYRFSNFRYFA